MAQDGKFRVLRLIAVTDNDEHVYVLSGAVEAADGDKAKRRVAAETKEAGVHVAVPPSSWDPEYMELELEPRVKAREPNKGDLETLPVWAHSSRLSIVTEGAATETEPTGDEGE